MNCHLLEQSTFDYDKQLFTDKVNFKWVETDYPQAEYSLSFYKCAKCGQSYVCYVRTYYSEYADSGSNATRWIPISEEEREIIRNDYQQVLKLIETRQHLFGDLYRDKGKVHVVNGGVGEYFRWFPSK